MSRRTNALILDEYRELFRDDAAYDSFVGVVQTVLKKDLSPVISDRQLIGAVLSPECSKEVLEARLLKRVSDSPDLLSELTDRLENDDIVD